MVWGIASGADGADGDDDVRELQAASPWTTKTTAIAARVLCINAIAVSLLTMKARKGSGKVHGLDGGVCDRLGLTCDDA
jgi:hypothetical protein